MIPPIIPLHDAGELRFPDQDGPWTIRCHSLVPGDPKEGFSPFIHVAIRMGSDRILLQKFISVLEIQEWRIAFIASDFSDFFRDRGLDVTVDPAALTAMIRGAAAPCMALWVEALASKYHEVLGSDVVANVWRTAEVRHILEK